MNITIEYCASCKNFQPKAAALKEELTQAFGPQTEVGLIPGAVGSFRVCVDGRQIFSKKEARRFPESGEIVSLLRSAS